MERNELDRHQRFERHRYFDRRLNCGYGYGRGWGWGWRRRHGWW